MKTKRVAVSILLLLFLFPLFSACAKGPTEPKGHSMGVWQTVTAPTYKQKGELVRFCTEPGCTYSESFRPKASSGLDYEEFDGKLLVSGAGSFKGSFLYISAHTPDGREVGGISVNAFLENENLRYVFIEEGVSELNGYAFAGCPSLVSAALPPSCDFLGAGFFLSCPALSAVSLPENITELPESFFDGCSSLEKITLPETLTVLGHSAMNLCTSLKRLDLPEGLTEIGSNCFDSCFSLESVSFPKSLRIIGSHAFTECTALTTLKIDVPLDMLSGFAFTNCTSLSSVFLSKDIVTVDAPDGFSPFYGCSKSLILQTDAPSKPEGWSENFSVYLPADAGTDGREENLFLTVRYNCNPSPQNE